MERIAAPPGISYIPQQPHMSRVRNIILEAIEVAFIISNTRKQAFDVDTIATLISCNIPTAFVLNTAYWVFFMSNRREGALCVCDRYRGGICKHVIENNYWTTIERSKSIKFTSDRTIPILEQAHIGCLYAVPKDVLVDINQIDHFGTLEVYIHFYVTLLPNEMDNINKNNNESCDYLVDNRKLPKHVIKTRFRIISEYEPAEPMIIFHPHPAMHNSYGHFIPELLNQYTYLSSYGHMKLIPEVHKLCALEIPPFTLVMEFLATWSLRPLWQGGPDISKDVADSAQETHTRKDSSVRSQNNRNNNNRGAKTDYGSLETEHYQQNLPTNDDDDDECCLRNLFSKCTICSNDNINVNGTVNEKDVALINQDVTTKRVLIGPRKLPDLLNTTWRNDLSSSDEYLAQPLTFSNRSFFDLAEEACQSNKREDTSNVGPRKTYASIMKHLI